MLMGDLNAESTEMAFPDFCKIYNLTNWIKDKICFKNPSKPTCIDLIRQKCFQHSMVIKAGSSGYWNKINGFSYDEYYSYENVLHAFL